MTDSSTRPTCGNFLPFIAAISAACRGSSLAGKSTPRKRGLASSTTRVPRCHSLSRNGPVPTGRAWMSPPRRLDDLARHRQHADQDVGDERVVDRVETQHQRVPVERVHAFDGGVVVDFGPGLAGRVDHRAHPDDEVGEQRFAAAAQVGVEVALDRVDVVGGDELPRPAAEGRVVGEQDPRLQPDGPRLAVRGDLGRAGRGVGDRLRRAAEVVPLVHRLEDRRADDVRVGVLPLLRVEGVDVAGGEPQHLRRVGGRRGKADHDEQRDDRPACRGVPPSVHPAPPAPGTADASARARNWPQPPSTSCPADWRSLVSTPRAVQRARHRRRALRRRAAEREAVDGVVRDQVHHRVLAGEQRGRCASTSSSPSLMPSSSVHWYWIG